MLETISHTVGLDVMPTMLNKDDPKTYHTMHTRISLCILVCDMEIEGTLADMIVLHIRAHGDETTTLSKVKATKHSNQIYFHYTRNNQ